MVKTFSYSVKEKLKSRKLLDELFASGKSFSVFPVKIFYKEIEEAIDFPVKVGVGSSIRHFKKAVDRNRIKRLLRESYRLHKQPLIDFAVEHDKMIVVFLLCIDRSVPLQETLHSKMPVIIDKLIKVLSENHTSNS
jgi:ribonuclease P protein component